MTTDAVSFRNKLSKYLFFENWQQYIFKKKNVLFNTKMSGYNATANWSKPVVPAEGNYNNKSAE
jgi:hypothetical protein